MSVITRTPAKIEEMAIYKILVEKSSADDDLLGKVSSFLKAAVPLLELTISGPFKNFTLHNPDHSKKLVYISECIMSATTIQQLSVLEAAVIIMASYLHDMGMVLTSVERQRIIRSDDYSDILRSWPEVWSSLSLARTKYESSSEAEKNILELEMYQLHEAALCNYLRPAHATEIRYSQVLEQIKRATNRFDIFEVNGCSFEKQLIEICCSHNEDVGVLADVKGVYGEAFPRDIRVDSYLLNTQFCAAILRLADILDFDNERTPKIIFDSLGLEESPIPGSTISLQEWKKHLSVHTIEIRDDEIIVSAVSNNPTIESGIRHFCRTIENEVRNTLAVIKMNKPSILDRYQIILPVSVRPAIRSEGYIYKELALNLNQTSIMKLLMGENLYNESLDSIREVLQNAQDACNALESTVDLPGYIANITVKTRLDSFDRQWIDVCDNGIGMDETVLTEYFFRVGDSYYDSPEFDRLKRKRGSNNFVPISRFGVGILSVFMISDFMIVETRNNYSPRHDTKYRIVRINGQNSLAHISEMDTGTQGTKISLRIKSGKYADLDELHNALAVYIQRVVVRPKYDVFLGDKLVSTSLKSSAFYKLSEKGKQQLDKANIVPVVIDLHRWSDLLAGVAILFFVRTDDEKLHHKKPDGTYYLLGSFPLEPDKVIKNYIGNRVSVNGFAMNLAKVGKLYTGNTARKLPMVVDLEITGRKDIEYNVTRSKIIGKGRVEIRTELSAAIIKGIKEMNLFETLTEEAQYYISKQRALLDRPVREQNEITDQDILNKVCELLPKTPWPEHVHKVIANELKIANGIAFRAIATLLTSGRVVKPN